MIRRSQVKCSISAGGCIFAAIMLLILPLPWLTSILLAAVIHEVCHLIALKFCGVNIYRIHIKTHGAVIETEALSSLKELICAAAGPAGSFLCLIFMRHFPMLALCGLLQGSYNLLPIYPLDGGRIVHAFTVILFPHHAEAICKFTSLFAVTGIFAVCLLLYIRTTIPFFLLFAGYFMLTRVLQRKTPCKDVQN